MAGGCDHLVSLLYIPKSQLALSLLQDDKRTTHVVYMVFQVETTYKYILRSKKSANKQAMMKGFVASHIIITLNVGIGSILDKVTNLHFQFISSRYIHTWIIYLRYIYIYHSTWAAGWRIGRLVDREIYDDSCKLLSLVLAKGRSTCSSWHPIHPYFLSIRRYGLWNMVISNL